MSGYVVTSEANADLHGIWLYISWDSEDIADRVQAEFMPSSLRYPVIRAKGIGAPTTRKPMSYSFPCTLI